LSRASSTRAAPRPPPRRPTRARPAAAAPAPRFGGSVVARGGQGPSAARRGRARPRTNGTLSA
jgi:hypothetical protein